MSDVPQQEPGPDETSETAAYDGSTPLAWPRREAFAQRYVFDCYGNASRSAREAGYSQDPKSSSVEGARLLANASVAKRVNYLRKEKWSKLQMSDEELLSRAAALVRADPRRVFAEDGTVLPVSEWGDEEGAMIAGIEVDEIVVGENRIGQTKKVKLRDSHAAMRTLLQVRKMIGADNTAVVNINMAERMERARKRVKGAP